ncbi:hypothetical protein [Paenibacillus contaminans]|uniref:Uncharacterized protein n=1 Tax=Paenibacillus contaminans TaxID=450362 RepID=A0A329LYU1_9BACL|nr:hypothetical protein [Paenibacillus contaminans]RAV12628.1 hypothetical protein DQG23_34150 [Paenibacillus contaminans]
MPMEEEVLPLLKLGFGVVMTVAFLAVIGLWFIHKKTAFAWITAHLVLFTLSAAGFLSLLAPGRSQDGMASENNSLYIAGYGILWAVSILCLLIGLMVFATDRRRYS